jgi:hypothetical protein
MRRSGLARRRCEISTPAAARLEGGQRLEGGLRLEGRRDRQLELEGRLEDATHEIGSGGPHVRSGRRAHST